MTILGTCDLFRSKVNAVLTDLIFSTAASTFFCALRQKDSRKMMLFLLQNTP